MSIAVVTRLEKLDNCGFLDAVIIYLFDHFLAKESLDVIESLDKYEVFVIFTAW